MVKYVPAPHLRFDRQDNRIEIGPLAPFPHLQRRGDLCPAQLDFELRVSESVVPRPGQRRSIAFSKGPPKTRMTERERHPTPRATSMLSADTPTTCNSIVFKTQ
jgi:hypothetical protein